jgi:hypothetical protein
MGKRVASDNTRIWVQIRRWAYQQLEHEALANGTSVADEISSIIQSRYEEKARLQALENIDCTVKAADLATDVIDQLLNALKAREPMQQSKTDLDYFGKKRGPNKRDVKST